MRLLFWQKATGPAPGIPLKSDRLNAVKYAERWWNEYNPEYVKFENDCTNYISQCLHAGNAPHGRLSETGKRQSLVDEERELELQLGGGECPALVFAECQNRCPGREDALAF